MFISNIHIFLGVDSDESFCEATEDENGPNNVSNNEGNLLFKVAGRQGFFTKTTSVHQKYANRPKGVENLTLSQFATSYSLCSTKPKNVILNSEDVTDEKGNIFDQIRPSLIGFWLLVLLKLNG